MNKPWMWAAGFALVMIVGRILTNWIMDCTVRRLPPWISMIFLAGYLGLISTFIWAALTLNWWGCLSVAAIFAATKLVRSSMDEALKSPKTAVYAAYKLAFEDLKALPPSDAKMAIVKDRVDQLMKSWGYPKKPDA